MFGKDLTPYIADFMDDVVLPWQDEQTCTGSKQAIHKVN